METNLLLLFVVLLALIVFTAFLNERTLKLPTEVAILISGLTISLVLLAFNNDSIQNLVPLEYLDDYLIKGVLCFMLFSGSYSMNFRALKKRLRLISSLAIFSTLISSLIYGVLCYFVLSLLNIDLSFLHCFLIGCIIAPTDPIAAMSILRKIGLDEDTGIVIEGESLFNDGVGIALFTVVSISIENGTSINPFSFFGLLIKEIGGALIIGFAVSYILFKFFYNCCDKYRQVLISLLAVSSAYVLCQELGFSSAIASVVCGIYFAAMTERDRRKEPEKLMLYTDFWNVIDVLLNYFLYMILGLTAINILIYTSENFIPIIITVGISILARFLGVFSVSAFARHRPENFQCLGFTTLLTWSGLKGALCLALALDSVKYFTTDNYHMLLSSVFFVVIFTTLVQGLTISKAYKALQRRTLYHRTINRRTLWHGHDHNHRIH